jgi:dolichyl-phosphate-mannose--protein O-mannosyl transferase
MTKFRTIILIITILGAIVRLAAIQDQPPFSDEVQVVFTAHNYIERGHFTPTMPHHPNLRNILVYISTHLLGFGAIGVRGFSLLFGIASIPLLAFLIYRMTSNVTASCLAAFFLAADPFHITFSRDAIQETHTIFLFLLGTYLALNSFNDEKGPSRWWLLPLSGIAFGLGLASKAHALFPMLTCLAFIGFKTLKTGNKGLMLFSVLSLSVIPANVYLLTDAFWFSRGYSFEEWIFMKQLIIEIMAKKVIVAPMEVNIDIHAWEWFIKPFLGYAGFVPSEGRNIISIATGNPLVWLLVLPSSIFLFTTKHRLHTSILIQAFFWISYLPLVFAPRPIFLLSASAVIPFAYALVGLSLSDLIKKWGGKPLTVYILAVVIVSLLLLPLSMGRTQDFRYLYPIMQRFNPHT